MRPDPLTEPVLIEEQEALGWDICKFAWWPVDSCSAGGVDTSGTAAIENTDQLPVGTPLIPQIRINRAIYRG